MASPIFRGARAVAASVAPLANVNSTAAAPNPTARTAVGVAASGTATITPAIPAAASARPRRGPESASIHGASASPAPTTIAATAAAIASFSPGDPHACRRAHASPSATHAPACHAARRVGPTITLYLLYRNP